ncbi:MAG: hypothetical protein NTV04_04280, partial [Deltaproteobacteria bacterium]|nr:hypothetical protein [Deltaproteobacteria bacterium]
MRGRRRSRTLWPEMYSTHGSAALLVPASPPLRIGRTVAGGNCLAAVPRYNGSNLAIPMMSHLKRY